MQSRDQALGCKRDTGVFKVESRYSARSEQADDSEGHPGVGPLEKLVDQVALEPDAHCREET